MDLRAAGEQLSRHTGTVATLLGAVATVGMAMGVLVAAALAPWIWRFDGAVRGVGLAGLALLAFVPGILLRRHRRDLLDAYGDVDRLAADLTQLGEAGRAIPGRVAALDDRIPSGRFARVRWAWRYLGQVRSIWGELGLRHRAGRLLSPIEPVRLVRSAWLSLFVVALTVVGPVVIVTSLLALAAR